MALFNFIEESGLIIPDTSDLLDEVNAEYRGIFGEDFIVDPETPEGALIAAEVSSRASVARNNATVGNQLNPNFAGGPFLDAILALTGGKRTPARRSTVEVTITGVTGPTIQAGSVARTTDGDEFESAAAVIIPLSGTVTATFQSVEFGPIAAPINSLTTIVDAELGWETITNPGLASLGALVESDINARARRRQTIGLQGRSTALAVISQVRDVVGVRSLTFRENVEDTTEVIDGITMVPHSIWVSVLGGADADIGAALLEAKGGGTNYNGDQSVTVVEEASGQSFPIQFDRPDPVPILVRVTLRPGTSQSINPVVAARQAIIDYANGQLEGEDGFVVGGDVSPYELGGAINRSSPELFVMLVELSFDTDPASFVTTTLTIDADQVATIIPTNIQVLTS